VLVQANDTWRPVTLADGDFDLDQLKKDISTADAKFAGRKYNIYRQKCTSNSISMRGYYRFIG
jgi:hypothetical protein